MNACEERIRARDTSLFSAIHSETTENDKKSLLVLQECARSAGEYTYLEIGSALGGTIQPHYVDPLCTMIYSIDKRPEFVQDDRGRLIHYPHNSSRGMLRGLAQAFPWVTKSRIRTFDLDASLVNPSEIAQKPGLCLIDGEHTVAAVFSDFMFCLAVSDSNAIIALHDANIITGALRRIEACLISGSTRFQSLILPDMVCTILLNGAVAYADRLSPMSLNKDEYFRRSEERLSRRRRENQNSIIILLTDRLAKYPRLYNWVRRVKRTIMRQNCPIQKDCFLTRGHQGECQTRL